MRKSTSLYIKESVSALLVLYVVAIGTVGALCSRDSE